MFFNYLEKLPDKIKTFISKFKSTDIAKIILIFVWLFLVGVMVFSKHGRTLLTVIACGVFVYFITDVLYKAYKNLEEDINIENTASKNANSNINECEMSNRCYPYYIEDFDKGTEKEGYFILDTSAFFAIQEYTEKRGYCVSDIIYGNIPMNDNFNYLAKLIRSRRCYVTSEVVEEIRNAENQKRLQEGVLDFVEEDIGVLDEFQKYSENNELTIPTYNELEKKPKLKHHILVQRAVMLSKTKNCNVSIITFSQRVRSLAKANLVTVVTPNEIKQEE